MTSRSARILSAVLSSPTKKSVRIILPCSIPKATGTEFAVPIISTSANQEAVAWAKAEAEKEEAEDAAKKL